MVVGAAAIELHVHGSQSLKQKRGVIRSIVQRVRNQFNVAVAEIGGQGTWQRADLAIVTTGSSERVVREILERALVFVEDLHLAEVLGSDVELLEMCYEAAADGEADEPDETHDDEDGEPGRDPAED